MVKAIKRFLIKIIRWFGYDVYRISSSQNKLQKKKVSPDEIAALNVEEAEYYVRWSSPAPLFAPWSGHPGFQAIYSELAPHTMVSPDRCYMLFGFAHYASRLNGDFAECGVYRGGTALLLCRQLGTSNRKIYLFDSFQGLPKENPEFDNYYREGDFRNESVESIVNLLQNYKNNIEIKVGWIPKTFTGLEKKQYAFVHVDVDLYQSAMDCCSYFYPRLVIGGVMVFDDYGFPACRGEKEAVDEFFADKCGMPIVLPTGQALIIKS